MKRVFWVSFIIAFLLGSTGISVAQQGGSPQRSKIPDEVSRKAQQDGVVRIIVQLDVASRPEAHLNQSSIFAQRQAIAAAQNKLLASLVGKRYTVTGRLKSIPAIGLKVDWNTLAALDFSPIVVTVELDRILRPTLPDSVKLVQADQAWAPPYGLDGAGWTIAVLDTGVDTSHPFLTRSSIYSPPTPPTAVAGALGTLSGTYSVIYAYVSGNYESNGSPASTPVYVSNQQVAVMEITLGPGGTSARKIYAFKIGVSRFYKLVGTIADNQTTTFTIADDESLWTTALPAKVIAESCFSGGANCPNGSIAMAGPGAGVPCTFAPNGCKHGTHVAGIAAGRGDAFTGIWGVAKGANVISIQVFSSNTTDCGPLEENPCPRANMIDVALALDYVNTDLRPSFQIASVNMSLGSVLFADYCDTFNGTVKRIIDDLRATKIATVIASGNDGLNSAITFPACISTAISVGATIKPPTPTSPEMFWRYSNLVPFVSLVAPGKDICSSVTMAVPVPPLSACPGTPINNFELMSGTSMAAPHVAGAWAILKQRSPAASVDGILAALQMKSLPVNVREETLTTEAVQCRIRIFKAFDHLGTTWTRVDDPTQPSTIPYGINHCGEISGIFQSFNWTRGYWQSNGVYTTFWHMDAPNSTYARGINNLGQIVGYYYPNYPAAGPTHSFLRNRDGTIQSLPDIAGNNTYALGINNKSVIVGYYTDASGRAHGFLSPGATIDYPLAFSTIAAGINDAGQVVGLFRLTEGGIAHAFLREANGTFTQIDPPGARLAEAWGINNAGQIVGDFIDAAGYQHGFLRTPPPPSNPTDPPTWTYFNVNGDINITTYPFGITDAGQTVGRPQFLYNPAIP